MSYCRLNRIDSDVYMYPSIFGGIVCCGGPIMKRSLAIKHLEEHREKGDKVPDYAIKRLEDEIKELGDDV